MSSFGSGHRRRHLKQATGPFAGALVSDEDYPPPSDQARKKTDDGNRLLLSEAGAGQFGMKKFPAAREEALYKLFGSMYGVVKNVDAGWPVFGVGISPTTKTYFAAPGERTLLDLIAWWTKQAETVPGDDALKAELKRIEAESPVKARGTGFVYVKIVPSGEVALPLVFCTSGMQVLYCSEAAERSGETVGCTTFELLASADKLPASAGKLLRAPQTGWFASLSTGQKTVLAAFAGLTAVGIAYAVISKKPRATANGRCIRRSR